MTPKNIQVPDGMSKAVDEAINKAQQEKVKQSRGSKYYAELQPTEIINITIGAALQWLTMTRQDMSPALLKSIRADVPLFTGNETGIYDIVNAALRRMFLAPEPETPDPIKNLLWDDWHKNNTGLPEVINGWLPFETHNEQIKEAYRRGQMQANLEWGVEYQKEKANAPDSPAAYNKSER